MADIKGAYLNAKMNDSIIIIVENEMVDYLVEVNKEKYKPHIHYTRKGKKILYVRLKKALYGCVQSALLWYRTLSNTLKNQGFVMNPYDPCVANKKMPD